MVGVNLLYAVYFEVRVSDKTHSVLSTTHKVCFTNLMLLILYLGNIIS